MNSREFTAGGDSVGSDTADSMYRAIAEASPDIVVCYDLEGRRTYVNPAYEKLSGLPAREMLGMPVTERSVLPPDLAAALRTVIMTVGAEGEPSEFVMAWQAGNGDDICFHLRAVPWRDGDGATIGVLTYARDVTEYRHAEMELRRREAGFRALAENSPDLIMRYDRNCRRIYVNPAFEKFSGSSVAEAIGKTPLDGSYLPSADAVLYQQKLLAAMSSGIPANFEFDWKRPDGKRSALHVVVVPERDRDGAVASVLTITRDLSDMKEVQGRLEYAEAMARLGYWQWDSLANKASMSAEACRIFGKPSGWSPSAAEVLESIVAEERDWTKAILSVVLASQSPDVSLDCRVQVGDQVLDLHSTIRIEYGTDGAPALLVGTIQDVSRMKRYEERVHALAYYDVLTELPNREMFSDRLHQAAAQASNSACEVGVLILDLDNFKEVNDTLGHNAGDQVLRETAARLRRCTREYDTVARLGGDEFGLVLTNLPPGVDIGNICGKMLTALGEPYQVGDKEIFLTGSIGIARYPADGHDIPSLIQYADAAMYHAKESGRNSYQFYAAALTRRITQRLTLAARLRRAETNGELELYYQPQIDLADGSLVGAEALLRWNHPDDGLLTPDRFIDIAEETGFIVGIGAWVLRTACTAACLWNRGREKPLRIAVNLSPRQFKVNDLLTTIENTLAETGCDPAWLELEITESILVEDADDVGHTLDALRAMNLSVAIDDFGTGYSALSYLNRFRVDVIKIDRSFVRDIASKPDNAELVKAIIAMAHSLRLDLVAEGIEDADQEEFLRQHGCQVGQGYLYGKPMQHRAFENLLAQRIPA